MFPFCLNTSTIKTRPLPEKIELTARAGYSCIELWCADVESYLGEGGSLPRLRAMLTNAGLQVPSMIALQGWGSLSGDTWREFLKVARRRLALAQALGCPKLVASPPREETSIEQLADHYGELLEIGRSIGTLPAMEFLGFTAQVKDLRTVLEILARTNARDATLVLDPFHVFRGGGSFADVRMVPGHRIGICHFNDAPQEPAREQQTDAHRVMPGDGTLPLVEMLQDIAAVGYTGPVSLELFRPDLWERDPLAVAREGFHKMRQIVEQAGL
jgi:sugar phosphate isomerase/epimerase